MKGKAVELKFLVAAGLMSIGDVVAHEAEIFGIIYAQLRGSLK